MIHMSDLSKIISVELGHYAPSSTEIILNNMVINRNLTTKIHNRVYYSWGLLYLEIMYKICQAHGRTNN